MSKEVIVHCDKCDKPGAKTLTVVVGKEADCGYCTVSESVDLCIDCTQEAVVLLMQSYLGEPGEQSRFLATLRRKKVD